MSTKKDVIIIGAGVIGCSIAYHLAKKGITSQIIERESIGARASGKAWAIQVYPPLYFFAEKLPDSLISMPGGESMAPWIDLYWSGWHRMAEIAQEIKEEGGIDIEYGEMGGAWLAASEEEAEFSKGAVADLEKRGFYEAGWIEKEEIRDLFPGINPGIVGGLYLSLCQWEPYKYTLGLAQAAEKKGVEVKQGEVSGFGTKGGKVISVKLASGKEIEADNIIIAMGPWSGQGTSWLGKEVPIQLCVEGCLRMEVHKPLPFFLLNRELCFVIPMVNGEVILAQSGKPNLQDHFDVQLSEDEKMETVLEAVELLPELEDAKLIEYRGDLEAWAPGPVYHRPVLGRLPGWDNAYIATRFGTMGHSMSAGVGAVMADFIAEGQVSPRFKKMVERLSPQ